VEQKMKLSDLIADPGTGMLSHTKLWTHIAYATVTATFLHMTVSGNTPGLDLWLVYLGIVGGHSVLSKLISMKYK
jgi:hypothetical protein